MICPGITEVSHYFQEDYPPCKRPRL